VSALSRCVAIVATVSLATVGGGHTARAAAAHSAPGATPVPRAARALLAALTRHGRAEVTVRRDAAAEAAGQPALSGLLALEPPDRARLDLAGGERIAVRGDGGEWLQPRLRQMVRLGADTAGGTLHWWRLLLDPAHAGVREQSLGGARWLLTRALEGGVADSAWVTLDAAGLPATLGVDDGSGGRVTYRLSGWRFRAARGRAAFVLAAPAGFEVVRLE